MISTQTLHGSSLINGAWVPGTNGSINGLNPATNQPLEPAYSLLDSEQLALATAAARQAFSSYSSRTPAQRAAFLHSIADNIDARRADIVERAGLETGLSAARLIGEVSRTSNQLRLFARTIDTGNYHRVRIDPAQPERTPAARADLRQRMIPFGPVAVFGASNFPLAFSTAGGDTASALAAGCPVVFKAHNAHPGTSELVAGAIAEAITEHQLHPGVFSLVYGKGAEIGQELAKDPAITAIGFTGSRRAGLALSRTAFERRIPIPVYAEMSATNPVFIFPGALGTQEVPEVQEVQEKAAEIAHGYVGAITGSSGQLCTKPGILFVPHGPAGDGFVEILKNTLKSSAGQTMLTADIAHAWQQGTQRLFQQEGVDVLVRGQEGETHNAPAPTIFTAEIDTLMHNPVLQEEIFGAASLVVRYSSTQQLHEAVDVLEGQLTATIHAAPSDFQEVHALVPALEALAGRVLFGGWPTGVEVGHAVIHGGPFPATSDSRTTSVGTLAIERFMRPVSYQSFPEELLPDPLKDDNPWNVARSVDGS